MEKWNENISQYKKEWEPEEKVQLQEEMEIENEEEKEFTGKFKSFVIFGSVLVILWGIILIASSNRILSIVSSAITGILLIINTLTFIFNIKKINNKLKEAERTKIKFIKYFIPILICFLLVLIQVNVIFNASKLVVKNKKVETGALINMDLDTFTRKFDKAHFESMKELTGTGENFGLSQYWNNIIPPQEDYTDTGVEFVVYSAFVMNEYVITATCVDDKINSINVSYEYGDDIDFIRVMYMDAMQAVGNMNVYEVTAIVEIIEEGIMEDTMVYKDGILYGMNFSARTYCIYPASKEFARKLETEGGCSIVYM